MSQRQISDDQPLPRCQNGHSARHMLDVRRVSAGGGHFVECACSASSRHEEYIDALREWCRQHGHAMPPGTDQRPLPLPVPKVPAFRPAAEVRV
ncbi:MAG TPA: hypothetical protein VD865_15080 [Stenotrophomonas sp.]|nr:hypothetical protein [Stenotrophomonas sp.]